MNKKLLTSGLIGLLGISTSCSFNQEIHDETNRILSKPIEHTGRDYLSTSEELPVYERGVKSIDSFESYTSAIPIKRRKPSSLLEFAKSAHPSYTFLADDKTNQLIVKIPKISEPNLSQLYYQNRNKEVTDLLDLVDLEPAQYRILAYSMRVSASKLDLFSSSLQLLIEKGNSGFSLNSELITQRAERGVEHSFLGILDPIIPQVQLDIFLNGLNRSGYVRDLSLTTLISENGDEARISSTQKVEVKKIIPQGTTPVIVPDFTDVKKEIKITPYSLSDNHVYLKFDAIEGDVTETRKELPNINTREISLNARLKLGQTLVIGSTLGKRNQGVVEESPLLNGLVSGREKEDSKEQVVYFIRPVRIDISKEFNPESIKELEEEIKK
jgi:type II secretory pathway component GspD/PulD (secretin)